jgi:hypothetical protein
VLDDETIEEYFAIGDDTDLLTLPDVRALDIGDETATIVTSAAPPDHDDPWADQAIVAFAAGVI